MPTVLTDSHFRVLGVSRQSSKEDIRKAYLHEIKKSHPDKFPDDSAKANEALERSQRINDAYDLLRDYDPLAVKRDVAGSRQPSHPSGGSATHKAHVINVTRYRIRSANIVSAGYDRRLQILQIEYTDRSIWQYYRITEVFFVNLMRLESKGAFVGRRLVIRYR